MLLTTYPLALIYIAKNRYMFSIAMIQVPLPWSPKLICPWCVRCLLAYTYDSWKLSSAIFLNDINYIDSFSIKKLDFCPVMWYIDLSCLFLSFSHSFIIFLFENSTRCSIFSSFVYSSVFVQFWEIPYLSFQGFFDVFIDLYWLFEIVVWFLVLPHLLHCSTTSLLNWSTRLG